MGGSNSESSSSQATTTSTTDQRVGADNGAVVIQAGGQQNISFDPNVANAATSIVHSVTDFSSGVVSAAKDILNSSITAQEKATNAVLDFGKTALAASPATPAAASSGIIQSSNLGTVFQSIQTPLIIAAVGLAAFFIFKKR